MREPLKTFKCILEQKERPLQENARAALEWLFKTRYDDLVTFKPQSLDETRDFIELLRKAVEYENKPTISARRVAALNNILHYVADPGESLFKDVTPRVFAFHLAARVRKPALINQAATDRCGANSIMIGLVRHDPECFVNYAISLIQKGKAKFYDMTVSAKSRQVDYTMNPADLVTIASLGEEVNENVIKLSNKIRKTDGKGVSPAVIEHWLRRANLSIESDCYSLHKKDRIEDRKNNLRNAVLALKAGKMVIISTNLELEKDIMLRAKERWGYRKLESGAAEKVGLSVSDGDSEIPVLSNKDKVNHWTLVSRLDITGEHVNIKLYTWGQPIGSLIPLDVFLTYYGGYIAATWPENRSLPQQIYRKFNRIGI
jgi:hypothetical protein